MLILRIIRYILGYARFEIRGEYPQRLINALSSRGVDVWGITRRGDIIEACILIRDYKKLLALKGKCRARIRHKRPVGLLIKLYSYRERVGFAVGIGIFFLSLKLLSLFIWQIDIVGNEYVEKNEIYSALENIGVTRGSRISEIDTFNIGDSLVLEMPQLAWAAINIEGSKATVNVSEVNIIPEHKENTPCNLKAKTDGVITGHTVTDGILLVKAGDAVVAGDLLVSGITDNADGTVTLRHASGEVFAETRHTLSYKQPFTEDRVYRTGVQEEKTVLEFFGFKIPLYLGSVQYEYESEYEELPMRIAGCELPISIHKRKFYEIDRRQVTLTPEEAEQKAREKLEELTKRQLPMVEIVTKEEVIKQQNDGIFVEYLYICNENIAFEEILSISTINF